MDEKKARKVRSYKAEAQIKKFEKEDKVARKTEGEKINEAKWDKLSKDQRKIVLKVTGSFMGNASRNWAELTPGAQKRILTLNEGATAVKAVEEGKKRSAKRVKKESKHGPVKVIRPAYKNITDPVQQAVTVMNNLDVEKGLYIGRWPEDAPNYAGYYFVVIPSCNIVIAPNCETAKEATTLVRNAVQAYKSKTVKKTKESK